jgi:uncharacterized protein (DUF433 family)
MTMDYLNNSITIDAAICNGKPVIRGQRIAVQTILAFLSAGDTIEDILRHYPSFTKQDIFACLNFAATLNV